MIYSHERKHKAISISPPPHYPDMCADFWPEMEEYLNERGLDFNVAFDNKWYPTIDGMGVHRIVIPCSNADHTVYYQLRAMGRAPAGVLRYVSPSCERGSSVVLVWPKRPKGTILVEGPMDALAGAGIDFLGIAFMGNNPKEIALDFAKSFLFEPVLIVPDLDSPELGPRLLTYYLSSGYKTRLILPTKKDLCEHTKAEREVLTRET